MTGEEGCWWCGGEATILCDASLGFERRKSDGTVIMDEHYTCDAPVCRECAKQIGHVSGEEPDSIDMCPEHRDSGFGGRVMQHASAKSADAARRAIRARAMRSRISVVR